MDEFETLRRLRPDVEPSEESLARGKARLERAIQEEQKARHRAALPVKTRPGRSRVWLPVLGAGLAAAAVAVFSVIVPFSGQTPAEAAELLYKAADDARFDALQLDPGSFLEVETSAMELTILGAADPSEESGYLSRQTITSYIPPDRDSDWIVQTSAPELVNTLPGTDAAGTDAQAEADLAERAETDPPGVMRWPGGRPAPTADDLANPDPIDTDAQILDAPRDPDELLTYITQELGTKGRPSDAAVFEWLRPVLADPSLPADLRAAAFDALASLDSVTISSESAAIEGAEGVGITFDDQSGDTRDELVLDRDSGRFLGYRTLQVSTTELQPYIPAGTVIAYSATAYRVSDSAPDVP
ncbi:hypothetical protein [Leucobacter sp. wl10]|uniref:hypothetical protein n=1 Tax=Leucobacter sp. wl10 TaxID=2304677 RepID=UPI000E5C05F1|nr:hypothetical protein [Leucobacter sp. wl10]RGE18039.1 hypothetical protein D1J51_14905 [Leucobacter sp. wl10]